MRSMFGVRYPMIPWLKQLTLNQPMSSLMMNKMFGLSLAARRSSESSRQNPSFLPSACATLRAGLDHQQLPTTTISACMECSADVQRRVLSDWRRATARCCLRTLVVRQTQRVIQGRREAHVDSSQRLPQKYCRNTCDSKTCEKAFMACPQPLPQPKARNSDTPG